MHKTKSFILAALTTAAVVSLFGAVINEGLDERARKDALIHQYHLREVGYPYAHTYNHEYYYVEGDGTFFTSDPAWHAAFRRHAKGICGRN